MTLAKGTRLGSYEVIGLLGAGGMGEVYRARDTLQMLFKAGDTRLLLRIPYRIAGAEVARQLIEGPFLSSPGNTMRTFDVSPDGNRFLMTKDARQTPTFAVSASLTVILNWVDELRRIAPSRN